MTWGIDYASVDGQTPPNWNMFQRAGGSFAFLRASFAYHVSSDMTWALAPDPTFERDWAGMKNVNGLVRGAYMGPDVSATQSAAEQVSVFAKSVADCGGLRPGIDFPPCLDIEFPFGIKGTGLSTAGCLTWIREAVSAMKKAFGVNPIIYTSGRVWNDTDTDCLGNPPAPDLVSCPLWLARYAYKSREPAVLPPVAVMIPVPTPWGDQWIAHQAQGDALGVPGFSSTTDIDRLRTAALGQTGGHVLLAQQKLGITADGDFGPNTQGAVRAYQTAQKLPDTGQLDLQTIVSLLWI